MQCVVLHSLFAAPGLAYFTAACQTQRSFGVSGLVMSQLAGLHGVATFLSTTWSVQSLGTAVAGDWWHFAETFLQGLHAAVLVALGKNNSGLYKALFSSFRQISGVACFFWQKHTEAHWRGLAQGKHHVTMWVHRCAQIILAMACAL